MNGSERIKDFEDPLFSRVNKANHVAGETEPKSTRNLFGITLLVAVLCILAYYLLQAQQRIDQLGASLTASQSQLSSVTEDLGASREKITTLEDGLSKSKSDLARQGRDLKTYQSMYTNLKSEQTQQSRELEAITVQKANQSDVDALKQETIDLKIETTAVREQVGEAQSKIAQLDGVSAQNQSDIHSNRQVLSQVSQKADSTAGDLAEFKRSFEREYYNFELQEKGGMMKIFDVHLRLRDVDFKRQRYELDIIAGLKRIKRKNQNINEPIFFYVEGIQKPYEVVVTKLDKKFAVGYLSVPKR